MQASNRSESSEMTQETSPLDVDSKTTLSQPTNEIPASMDSDSQSNYLEQNSSSSKLAATPELTPKGMSPSPGSLTPKGIPPSPGASTPKGLPPSPSALNPKAIILPSPGTLTPKGKPPSPGTDSKYKHFERNSSLPKLASMAEVLPKGIPSPNTDSKSKTLQRSSSSSKLAAMAERRIARGLETQQQLNKIQEELKMVKDQLAAVEEEKSRALSELEEIRKVAEDTNMRLCQALSAQKQAENNWETEKVRFCELEQASVESAQKRDQAWQLELEAVQKQHALDVETFSTTNKELDRLNRELSSAVKAKNEALKQAEDAKIDSEANAKQIEDLLVEFDSMRKLLESAKVSQLGSKVFRDPEEESETSEASESETPSSSVIEPVKLEKDARGVELELTEKDSLIKNLKLELHKARESEAQAKESETKTFESLVTLTKQLEETKISLEEAKLEVATLNENSKVSEGPSSQIGTNVMSQLQSNLGNPSLEKTPGGLNSLKTAEGASVHAQKEEQVLSSNYVLAKEMNLLRNELRLASEAEEKSRKAMDDLAFALKEVTVEGNRIKKKMETYQSELENAKKEAENSKLALKSTEEKYQVLLDESRREIAHFKGLAERLELEAEESHASWNGKEEGFVECMKISGEEIACMKQENSRLMQKLREAEEVATGVKHENSRLRDILKQAINESTVAKEAAEIARTENSQLKDSLLDMAGKLQIIGLENEQLKFKESESVEAVKELKSLLDSTKSGSSAVEGKENEAPKKSKTATKEGKKVPKSPSERTKKHHSLSLDLGNPKFRTVHVEAEPEILKGSIFHMVDLPEGDDKSALNDGLSHRRAMSIAQMDDVHALYSDDFDPTDVSQFDDILEDDNRSSGHSKKKALLRRFGHYMLRGKRSKESSH